MWRGKKKGEVVEVPHYCGFYSPGHFMASYLMDEEKVSLKTVSGMLRHKNVRTTEIYLHTIDTSKVAAANQIEGKFALKNENRHKTDLKAATE